MQHEYLPMIHHEDDEELLTAAASGDIETVKKFKDKKGMPWGASLSKAAKHGNLACVKLILEQEGVDREERDRSLGKAARAGQVPCVKSLMDAGCSLRAQNLALKNAASLGELECVKAILPFSEKAHSGHLSAKVAAFYDHDDCLAILFPDNPSNIETSDILREAVRGGSLKCVSLLLDEKDPLDDVMTEALCMSIDKGYDEVTKRLLSDSRVKEHCKTTRDPLFSSVAASNRDVLDTLLTLSLSVGGIEEEAGGNMLRLAARNKDEACLKLLLQKTRARPRATHILMAITSKSQACVQVLADEVDLNDKKTCALPSANTHPLIKACTLGHSESIRLLAARTKDVGIINIALLSGMQSCLESRGVHRWNSEKISYEDLAPLFQKTTYKSLALSFNEAKASGIPEGYFTGWSEMSEEAIGHMMDTLERELETLARADIFRNVENHKRRTRKTSVKL